MPQSVCEPCGGSAPLSVLMLTYNERVFAAASPSRRTLDIRVLVARRLAWRQDCGRHRPRASDGGRRRWLLRRRDGDRDSVDRGFVCLGGRHCRWLTQVAPLAGLWVGLAGA